MSLNSGVESSSWLVFVFFSHSSSAPEHQSVTATNTLRCKPLLISKCQFVFFGANRPHDKTHLDLSSAVNTRMQTSSAQPLKPRLKELLKEVYAPPA